MSDNLGLQDDPEPSWLDRARKGDTTLTQLTIGPEVAPRTTQGVEEVLMLSTTITHIELARELRERPRRG